MNIRNYNHSRPLDVHLSSNHPEVNNFINAIYDEHFNSPTTNHRIVKKHLKTVLLDLYVAWHKDPNLNISVYMSPNAYSDGTLFSKGKSRYNHLNIKRTIIDVIHKLVEVGLVSFKSGFEGRLSRIWPSDPLIEYFKKALFDEFDIGYSEDREVIILKDEDKVEIEYKDTATTNEMRTVVQQYNALLRESFIDIPTLETPVIPYKDQLISMGQHDKFVRRIFNNNSFEEGGRFAGGWWQKINEKQRSRILINDKPTVEIDFKALHPILAYATKDIDYWETASVGSNAVHDPYDIPVDTIDHPDARRSLVKLLFLMALNAKDEKKAYQAVMGKWDYSKYPYHGLFTHDYLARLLETIKEYHSPIADLFCTGAGINLMNTDSQIVEYIIKDFTEARIPILTIHDSFVVPFGLEDRLHTQMQTAFEWITGNHNIKTKFNTNMTVARLHEFKYGTGMDREYYLSNVQQLQRDRCKGYVERYEKHKRYFSQQ